MKKVDVLTTTGCKILDWMYFLWIWHDLEKGENRFQRLKHTHPKQYDYCMRPVDEKGLGLAEVLDFIGVEH